MLRRLIVLTAVSLAILPLGIAGQVDISARAASLRIGGRLQTQYAVSSIDGVSNDLFHRRARLIADATITDFFSGRVQVDFAGGGAELKDGYVQMDFSEQFVVSVGQFKRAFDLFELASSTDLSIIERDGRIEGFPNPGDPAQDACTGVGSICSYSRFTEALGFSDRDQGVRVTGTSGQVSYMASITNGRGANVADENDAKSLSGRVTYAVNENVSVSGQVALHDYVEPSSDDARALAWGGDVEMGTWRDGLHVQAAVVGGDNWRELGPGAAFEPASFLAAQGVVSYYYPLEDTRFTGIEPVARLSYGDPDTAAASDGGVLFTPGVMLYILGRNKIGANFDVYSPQTGDKEFSFKVQTFLYF